MTLLDSLIQTLREAGNFNRHAIAKPSAILWTDGEGLWLPLVEAIAFRVPEFFVVTPTQEFPVGVQTGNASALRYVMAKRDPSTLPILYFPGVARTSFRSPETFPKAFRHLFPQCHLGSFFGQSNGRDWTPIALIQNLPEWKISFAKDQKTADTLQENLLEVFLGDPKRLIGPMVTTEALHGLSVTDPARMMLEWIGSGERVKTEWKGATWSAFVALAKSDFDHDPLGDGVQDAAEKLATLSGHWESVWERFCEAPGNYPNVTKALEKVTITDLFGPGLSRSPKYQVDEEKSLLAGLKALAALAPHLAKDSLLHLVLEHGPRAEGPWAEIGLCPLAKAVRNLGKMLDAMQCPIASTDWKSLIEGYLDRGWKVDSQAWKAISMVTDTKNYQAVASALQGVYMPWLAELAQKTQKLEPLYPMGNASQSMKLVPTPGELVLFVDGLRADVALELVERLDQSACPLTIEHFLSALPSVTATAKPAWTPLAGHLDGGKISEGFEPRVKAKGKVCNTVEFRQLLKQLGFTWISAENENTIGIILEAGWLETGELDKQGHAQGGKLGRFIEAEITNLQKTIADQFEKGWKTIRLITDHGWLWLPGGLPKQTLPGHLTLSKWGRCALPEQGAKHGLCETPWFWGNEHSIVLAPGISVFSAGVEYAHGGLSLQECLRVHLFLTPPSRQTPEVSLLEMKWRGLRLAVQLGGTFAGLTLDVRTRPADPLSSVLDPQSTTKPFGDAGTASVIASENFGGSKAILVILKGTEILLKQTVTVGEN